MKVKFLSGKIEEVSIKEIIPDNSAIEHIYTTESELANCEDPREKEMELIGKLPLFGWIHIRKE